MKNISIGVDFRTGFDHTERASHIFRANIARKYFSWSGKKESEKPRLSIEPLDIIVRRTSFLVANGAQINLAASRCRLVHLARRKEFLFREDESRSAVLLVKVIAEQRIMVRFAGSIDRSIIN